MNRYLYKVTAYAYDPKAFVEVPRERTGIPTREQACAIALELARSGRVDRCEISLDTSRHD